MSLGRRFVSVVGLVAVVAGIPAILVGFVGWPLPRRWPSLEQLRSALADGWRPDETFVLGVLAVIGWILWSQLVRHVAAEIAAHRHGRAGVPEELAPAAPGGLGPRVAGWLVSGLFAAGPVAPAAVLAVEQPRIPVVLTQTRGLELVAASSEAPAPAPASAAPEAPAPSYVVGTWEEGRDCLWTIAERHLGDPMRWPELLELNAEVHQPSGRRLVDDPQHWVYPGMELRLPADAAQSVRAPEPPAVAPVTGESYAPVETPAVAPVPAPAPAPVSAPAATQAVTTTTSPPPAQALPMPNPGREAPSPAPVAGPAGRSTSTSTSTPAPESDGDQAGSTAPVVLAGSGLLAAGVVMCLDRRRRAQQRHRRRGRRIRMPDAELVETERALRVGADEVGAEVVDVVLRSMAEAAGQLDQGLPDVVAVELDQSSLRVVFAAPPPPSPPEPWTADQERRFWELRLEDMDLDELRTLAGRVPAPLPALVSLGAHDHGAQVLFNLEGTGVTEIVAEAGRAEEVLAALALELATCPWADFVDVVLVGFGDELEWLERARRAERMDDVVAALEHEAYGLAEVLDSSGWSNVVSARVQGPAADWVPTVVLCATGLDDVVEERLAKLSGEVRHAGVTVVVAGEVAEAAQRRLVIEGDRVRVEPMGVCARRERWLDADQLQSVVALLEVAGDTEDVAPAASTYEPTTGDLDELSFEVGEEEAVEPGDDWSAGGAIDEDPANGHRTAPAQAVAGEAEEQALDTRAHGDHMLDEVGSPDQARPLSNGSRPLPAVPLRAERWLDREGEAPEVEVRVLGPVEVVGRGPVPRAKSLEAIVYLAMHRDGADSDRLRWALWPEGSKRTTWDTTSSVARNWLGQASDGTLLLPKAYHNRGLFRLDELVGTDYQRFRDAVALAEHLDGAAAVALLRSALERVRGRLFDGLVGRAHWVKYEGHYGELEAEIVDAALRMSELCLATGDVEAATWAAHRAQRVSPYDEGLTRALMKAADRAGNPAGVEAAWDDICAKVEADVEPYDQVHPETLALYQKLRRSSKTLV